MKATVICVATTAIFTSWSVRADDYDNAWKIGASMAPLGRMLAGAEAYPGNILGFHVNDAHNRLLLYVPSGRVADAQKAATYACARAADGSMTWESTWGVHIMMNGEDVASCGIYPQKKTKENQEHDEERSATFDELLKSLEKRDPSRN